jgi:hypothetical protein
MLFNLHCKPTDCRWNVTFHNHSASICQPISSTIHIVQLHDASTRKHVSNSDTSCGMQGDQSTILSCNKRVTGCVFKEDCFACGDSTCETVAHSRSCLKIVPAHRWYHSSMVTGTMHSSQSDRSVGLLHSVRWL